MTFYPFLTYSKKVNFINNEGKTLSAIINRPHAPVKAAIIFAHCFTCGKNLKAAKKIAEQLAGAGYAVMRFDFTGLGQSQGNFTQSSFSSNKNDILAAAAYMDENVAPVRMLMGHSFGGTAVLSVAAQMPQIKAIATIGSPYEAQHITHLFADKIDEIHQNGLAEIQIGHRPFYLGQSFLDDILDQDISKDITKVKAALMIMHSPIDQIVDIHNATQIFMAAAHPKSFISLDQADHLLSDETEVHKAALHLIAFAHSYIDASDENMPSDKISKNEVLVSESAQGEKYTNDILTSDHHLIADEPESMGGGNLGMTPYQLLSSALGACTSITLRMYAERKKWPVEHIGVILSHKKELKEGKKKDVFTRRLQFQGALTKEQKQRLLEIADKCPVHHTLQQSSDVVSYIDEADLNDKNEKG